MSVLSTLGNAIQQGPLGPIIPGGPNNPFTTAVPTGFGPGSLNDSLVKDTKIKLSDLWVKEGGPASQKMVAAAVAKAESQCNNEADNNVCCACSMQVNYVAHPQYDRNKLKNDPVYCMKAAVAIWHSQGWNAWQTYSEGTFKQYMGQDCTITLKKGSVTGTVKDAVDTALSPLEAIASFFSLLTQASTWFRVGKVVIGTTLLLIIFIQLIRG